jgi:hypothetical protein
MVVIPGRRSCGEPGIHNPESVPRLREDMGYGFRARERKLASRNDGTVRQSRNTNMNGASLAT